MACMEAKQSVPASAGSCAPQLCLVLNLPVPIPALDRGKGGLTCAAQFNSTSNTKSTQLAGGTFTLEDDDDEAAAAAAAPAPLSLPVAIVETRFGAA
mmetsp:Transcript_35438/g.76470  ORF Transcript_35438/g.76470 Transcript_35438/m.76470 type:complete len:97 (+) Transcript_35438:8-298(+)